MTGNPSQIEVFVLMGRKKPNRQTKRVVKLKKLVFYLVELS